jgi:Ca-activated chloride channel homolog
MLNHRIIVLIFCALAVCGLQTSAQQTIQQSPQVRLNVRVLDGHNRPVSGVRQEELRVSEEGIPQTISFFSAAEAALSYGLLIDSSGSMRPFFGSVIEAARNIIRSNGPEDETFLVRFISNDRIETLQDFTSNTASLLAPLPALRVEAGQTALVDAIYISHRRLIERANSMGQGAQRRRALILITDGEDRDSHFRLETLINQLRASDVQIYAIGLVSQLNREGGIINRTSRERAVHLLEQLAEETGGQAFFPRGHSELQTIASELTNHIRAQYVVGYTPNTSSTNPYRRVRVEITNVAGRDQRRAVTRKGYTAPR